jgi:hypothetical protein
VTIRSGEHADFSRLVLSIPGDTDWTISEIETGYIVGFGDPVVAVEISNIYERIPRERLADVVTEGAELTLDVVCDCHIDAFLYRPGMLVIDVIDGPAPPDLAFVPSALPETSTIRVEPVDTAPVSNIANLTTQSLPRISVELPLFTQSQPWSDFIADVPASYIPEMPRDPNLVEAERAIIESFARAATQGIFDFPARPLPPPPEDGVAQPPTPIAPMSDPMDGVPIPLTAADPEGPGFLLRTGIERNGLEGVEPDAAPASCPQDVDLNMSEWGEAEGFGTLISQLRLAVTDEAGNSQPDAIHKLARAYIYYGFGLEARQALATIEEPSKQTEYLFLLARLVDGDPVPVVETLQFRSCGPSMEAWIALASGRLDTSDERIHSSILMAYRAMPDALRGHLGVRLAQIFAEAGKLHDAQEILSSSIQATTGGGRESELAEAGLAGRTDGIEAEFAQLDEFIETNPRAQPEDMVRLLDLARQTDTPIDDSILEIAEGMRFEADNHAPAAALVEAEVRLLLDQDQPQAAFALLNGDVGPMSPDLLADLHSEATIVFARTASEDAFLPFAFSPLPPGTNHAAQNAVAARLIDLGFPSEALALIAAPLTGHEREDRLLQQARAESMIGMTDTTEPTLIPDPTMITDLGSAPILGDETEGSPLDGAWRAGEWATLEASDDPLLSSASRALLTPVAPPGDETPLADSRALLEQAQETRTLTDDLLTRFTLEGFGADPVN